MQVGEPTPHRPPESQRTYPERKLAGGHAPNGLWYIELLRTLYTDDTKLISPSANQGGEIQAGEFQAHVGSHTHNERLRDDTGVVLEWCVRATTGDISSFRNPGLMLHSCFCVLLQQPKRAWFTHHS